MGKVAKTQQKSCYDYHHDYGYSLLRPLLVVYSVTMSFRRLCLALCIVFHSLSANAQLSKGNQILIEHGLQLQGLCKDDCYMHLDTYSNANYTSILWSNEINVRRDDQGNIIETIVHSSRPDWMGTAPGFLWGRWAGDETNMPPYVTQYGGDEAPFMSQLITLQLSDEWELNQPEPRTRLVDWFNAVRTNYPNTILYHNSYGGQVSDGPLADFYTRAHPDMLSFDTYPFWYNGSGTSAGDTPFHWYGDLRRYREHARGANIPFGCYIQTYHSETEGVRNPSQSELRLLHFAALGFNAKVLMDFIYNTGATTLFDIQFNGSGDSFPNAMYYEKADINKRARNLGKALVRLQPIADAAPNSYTTGMMFVRGKDPSGSLNPFPIGFYAGDTGANAFTDWASDRNDPYLRGWVVTNKGTKNSGNAGDVIISWFKPLDESFDGPNYTNEIYMMVVNGLCDPTGTPADCLQEIKLNFLDTFTTVELLNPTNGLAEAQVLPVVSTRRQLVLNLNGGDAALFKFSDGAPFLGVPPVITNQPVGLTRISGTSATFTVGANGDASLVYQWKLNGTNIATATTSSFTINQVQSADAGNYTVVLTHTWGSVTSSIANLNVLFAPQISIQPQDQTVTPGANASFSVTASASPSPTYQWRVNGLNISGATGSSYTRPNVQAADAGNYSVVLANTGGSVTSSNALLTISGPPFITGQPQNRAALVGGTTTFNVIASGVAPLYYRWQKGGSNLSDNGSISGATTTVLTLSNVQASDLDNYTVIVSNIFGAVTSIPASLSIATQPAIQSSPQSRTNNAGTTATFNVIASGAGLSYQWQHGGTNLVDGSNITGAATDTLILNSVTKSDAGTYTVAITNAAGNTTSPAATLTILTPLPWYEPFNYISGAAISGQVTPSGLVWADVGTGTAGTNVTIEPGNLPVTNLASSVGNSIRFGGLGKSARLSFSPTFTSGTVYFSFALKVTDLTGASAAGGFFAGFNNSTGTQAGQPTIVDTRLYLRTASGGFNIGMAKSSDVATDWVWDPRTFTTNETVFIVGSYTFNTGGTANDASALWINPAPSDFGVPTAPASSMTSSVGTDIASIASFVFFKRSTTTEAAVMLADELRFGTTWASVTPAAAPVKMNSMTILQDGRVRLQGAGNPGNFIIETSRDLLTWTQVKTILSTGGAFEYIEPASYAFQRFYRINLVP
ncbi:MAG: hypothetical protein JWM68_503 [Verrucomicrobiales bacterium]|nr:hypothetical protein [Verrucomicrobiales bacterium]